MGHFAQTLRSVWAEKMEHHAEGLVRRLRGLSLPRQTAVVDLLMEDQRAFHGAAPQWSI